MYSIYYYEFVSCGNIPEAVLTAMLAYTKATRNNVISMLLALLVLSGVPQGRINRRSVVAGEGSCGDL